MRFALPGFLAFSGLPIRRTLKSNTPFRDDDQSVDNFRLPHRSYYCTFSGIYLFLEVRYRTRVGGVPYFPPWHPPRGFLFSSLVSPKPKNRWSVTPEPTFFVSLLNGWNTFSCQTAQKILKKLKLHFHAKNTPKVSALGKTTWYSSGSRNHDRIRKQDRQEKRTDKNRQQ